MEYRNVAERLERQQQAMKGLVQTLSSLREAYCLKLASIPETPGSMSVRAVRLLEGLVQATGEIMQAVNGVNSLHACIGLSVVSQAAATAVRALPGAQGNDVVQRALAPLDNIVETKVWSLEERRHLFKLCFRILHAFDGLYKDLINEVQVHFPEETAPDKAEA